MTDQNYNNNGGLGIPPPDRADMASSPAPLINKPARKGPQLGLSIPPSPNQRAVNSAAAPPIPSNSSALPLLQTASSSSTSHAPKLRLDTPMGSNQTPQPMPQQRRRPGPQLTLNVGTPGGSVDSGRDSRTSSNIDTKSGASSNISFGALLEGYEPPSPESSVEGGESMGREGSTQGIEVDLKKLSIEKGRALDVQDLDDMGWKAAKREGRIIELGSLGEGAGGAVTRCKLDGGKTVFALKIITTDPDPDVKKQIVRELSFNKSCASAHICEYYGAFMDDQAGTIGISMEFCEGGSLDSVYREVKEQGGRTGEKVLGKIAEGVLNGLTYLHSKKIIHRDIKPSNILLTRSGRVKLCDFGVSGEFGTKGDANTFIGTSYYMAPERITGQSYTITSDVWSLGVTLLEVAQHRFPFPADGTEMNPRAGLIDLLTYIVRQPLPKLKDEPDTGVKWSDLFKYFIECCLEKEPTRRATPWRMLEHPWMVEMKRKNVDMEKFLRTVWDWKD